MSRDVAGRSERDHGFLPVAAIGVGVDALGVRLADRLASMLTASPGTPLAGRIRR